jgi:hypothetical protein
MSPSVAWHVPHALVGCAGLRGGRDLSGVTVAASAGGQLAVRCGDLSWLRGKRCRGLTKSAEIVPLAAPRVVAAVVAGLRAKRPGRWRRHGATFAPRSARKRACLCRGACRCGASARALAHRRGQGAAMAPVHCYYLE